MRSRSRCLARRRACTRLAAALVAAGSLALPSASRAVLTAGEGPVSEALPSALAQAAWPVPRLEGVARLASGCSAVLLQGGRALLGAAHCGAGVGSTAMLGSGETVVLARITTAPGWAGTAGVHDLAVLTLATPARTRGYRLASVEEVDAAAAVLVAGWGAGGTPGALQPPGELRHGFNEYDGAYWPAGQPLPPDGPRIRLFDFDDGGFGSNTLGLAPGGWSGLGFGAHEAMLAGLDSGGPSLVPVPVERTGWRRWLSGASDRDWGIAAIHVGIDGRRGSAFGGLGLDLLVAPYAAWIAEVLARPHGDSRDP